MFIGTKRLFSIAATALLATSALGACSTKSSATPVAQSDLPLQIAHAICDSIKPCCAQTAFAYDQAACVTAVQSELDQDFVKLAGTTYDATAAGNCVAKYREVASSCADPAEGDDATDDACSAVFVGAKKNGEACDKSAECAPSPEGRVRCEHYGESDSTGDEPVVDGGTPPATSATGTQCKLYKKNPAKGDPCGTSKPTEKPPSIVGDCESTRVGATLYCDYKTNTCEPLIAIGQPCAEISSGSCASGGSCTAGKCIAAIAEGGACQYAGCATGLYCAPDSAAKGPAGKCAKQKKTGEACSEDADYGACASGSCSESKCSAGSFATASVCKGKDKSASSGPRETGSDDGGKVTSTTDGG